MKYDRPVWQLMYQCAAAMPDPFRYEDVRTWFGTYYPEVGQATIRAHLVGMSEGGRPKQPQFASRAPLFRRVARGRYEVIPEAERKIDPDIPPGVTLGEGPEVDVDEGAARFADSAFEDATVVHPAPPAAAVEPAETPAPPTTEQAAPAPVTADDADFRELIRRAGLEQPAEAARPSQQPTSGPTRARPLASSDADVVLLASDGERVLVPAPAREVYRAESFQKARVDAQRLGATWYVLSVEHGLLEPTEWMSPDSRSLADLDPQYRLAWAHWVVARLQSLDGSVRGRTVRVEAPPSYIGPLAAVLQDAGAVVSVAVAGGGDVDVAALRHPSHVSAVSEEEVRMVVGHLADAGHAIRPDQLDAVQDVPGLFAWHVDADGARQLNRSLRLPVGEGVLHVGHAGAVGRSPDAIGSLRHLVRDVQLAGRSRSTTFRASLAAALRAPLRMSSWDDPALTRWMNTHLTVVTWPTTDRSSILALAHRAVEALEPPLNTDHLRAGEMRRRLGQLRSSSA